jgi:hypothetical protein
MQRNESTRTASAARTAGAVLWSAAIRQLPDRFQSVAMSVNSQNAESPWQCGLDWEFSSGDISINTAPLGR